MDYQYPEVTISALAETGQEESSIVVPLQHEYTSKKPVIPSSLANTLCAFLGVQGLLDQLNTTLGTSCSLDNPFLSFVLEDCIEDSWDFGLAYSYLHQIWYIDDWSIVKEVLWWWSNEDEKKRREALIGDRIVRPQFPPRHVWDLYSNWPISHAWVDKKDRTAVWMPINGYEWPVPIPKDADLNLIHIEMLNLGAEYMWLDVLGLRQEGRPREDLHVEEWRLDVPIIGAVYFDVDVVFYLSGLGRPLMLNEGDLDSDRSWFRCAWMLQEVGEEWVIAGDTPDGLLPAECKDGEYATELLTRFHKKLEDTNNLCQVDDTLVQMRMQVSMNPVDKIMGLAFVMAMQWIPAYSESVSLEHAWTALMDLMSVWHQAQLFFLCAELGDAGPKWWPSWHQVMTKPLLPYQTLGDVDRMRQVV
ncbi:hypothetical protein IW261DRAFT_1343009 [Armillaria novae-zelandiae]|uniref:Uncharacterized protein n=1 Tax=Armillaria novae-zelandiae TaxID=153914 RepID=A0AA39NW73_9AGAR|nr:hypothetical protein IW261DRAFT_1343009 [Armillaria novae-zelandiae]